MVRKKFTALALAALCTAAALPIQAQQDVSLYPKIKVETTLGDFVIELNGEKAPITTLNFLEYVESKYYVGTIFHRVIPNFMIQGGGHLPNLDEKGGTRDPIKNEWKNGLKNVVGTVAMARTRLADSATAQFFINVADNANLDGGISGGAGYAVFGKIVEGQDTVEKIKTTKLAGHPNYSPTQEVTPVEAVIIKSVTAITEYDKEKITAQIPKERTMESTVKAIEEETGKAATTTASGLVYFSLREGEGPKPSASDTVTVHYLGTLLDGTKFDSSYDRNAPASFGLSQVISGWTEGVALMPVGSKYKFVIPSQLAYGSRGAPPTIPADAPLIFEVELISID